MENIFLCQETNIYKPNRVCNYEDCNKGACCNYAGQNKRRFCAEHKLPNMINVASKRCDYDNCNKIPTYMSESKSTTLHPINRFCKDHKIDGMIDKHKTCEFDNCKKRPHYNIKGLSTPKFCSIHKSINMINVVSITCENQNCDKRPHFNFVGEKTPRFCNLHKEIGMTNIRSKLCRYPDCKTQPSFNYIGQTVPHFCKTHKEIDMVDILNYKCSFNNCHKQPAYNYEYEKAAKFCSEHKLQDMIDIRSKSCESSLCNKRPNFNYAGLTVARFCLDHKLPDMIDIKHKTCKTHMCSTRQNPKYAGYCLRCYIYTFPDKPVVKNYKTKEFAVVEYVLKLFPNMTWTADKRIENGCSKKRPDLLLDLGYQIIIVEIDENQHTDYDCSCENKRLMELSQDVGHRPIIFIRFNPDDYINDKNEKIRSCWSVTKETGIIKIANKNEWMVRLESLKSQIEYWSNIVNKSDKTVEVVHLYFD